MVSPQDLKSVDGAEPGSRRLFPMFFRKIQAARNADGDDSREKNQQRREIPTACFSDAEENEPDCQIQKSPKGVHQRRLEAFSGWMREGRGKTIAAYALHVVRDSVGEEHPREKTCDKFIPLHFVRSFRLRDSRIRCTLH